RHWINMRLASASEARNLGSEGEPSSEVARNHLIWANAGAPECCAADELRDRLVNLKLLRMRAVPARTPALSARFGSKPTGSGRLTGLHPAFHQAINDLLRTGHLFHWALRTPRSLI